MTRIWRIWWKRLRGTFRRADGDAELSAELESHLRMHAEDGVRAGLTPDEARRRAKLRLGGVEQTKEAVREQRRLPVLETLLQDLRFAARMLRKHAGYTGVEVLTLALGIGATTAIFSVVYGVLLRPLEYRNPEQIVRMWEVDAAGSESNLADPNFVDLRTQNQSLLGMAEYAGGVESVGSGGESRLARVTNVSEDFFGVMGVQPVMGRGFAAEERKENAPIVALVSYAYWRNTLGAPADLSKVKLRVESQAAPVVGVMPAGFQYPDGTDIWLPREVYGPDLSRTAHNWRVVGRLKDGVQLGAAKAELGGIAARLKQQYGREIQMTAVSLVPLRESLTGSVRPALLVLLGASAFLLLIACANVVNLLLGQAAARERELCVRSALGAERGRLVRQFLTETMLLSVLGGVLGVAFAYWGVNALLAIAPKELPRLSEVSIQWPVLAFSLATVLAIAMGMGVFCALRAAPDDPLKGLNEGGQRQAGSAGKQRVGRWIVMAQVATTLVLLIGAGLLGRSLLSVLAVDPGFRPDGVVTMELQMPPAPKLALRAAFFRQLLANLRNIPGVESAGGVNALPLTDGGPANGTYAVVSEHQISPRIQSLIPKQLDGTLDVDPKASQDFQQFFEDLFHQPGATGDADYTVADEGFFETLRIPLLQGRLFDDRDAWGETSVAVVSKRLADERWPAGNAIGQTIEFGNMDGDPRLLTVVGVVGDVRARDLESKPRPVIYVNYRQRPRAAYTFTIVMRSAKAPETVIAAARQELQKLDPDLPPRFSTLSATYAESLGARRFSFTLVGLFSWTALLLAIGGIYGVTSYAVTQRTREIGVRMALGASRGAVLGMIVAQGARVAAVGVLLGLGGAMALSRWLASQLFGVSTTDPMTFAGLAALLLGIAVTACWIPARRAARVDPMIALRYE